MRFGVAYTFMNIFLMKKNDPVVQRRFGWKMYIYFFNVFSLFFGGVSGMEENEKKCRRRYYIIIIVLLLIMTKRKVEFAL